jgi:hypothetical protein
MSLASGGMLCFAALAQDPSAGVIFFQLREFNIPFKNDPNNANVALVRLYVSTDQGRKWQLSASASPDGKQFRFSAPQDGYYWFAVQTVYKDQKTYPATVEELRPSLKVVVDSTPPSVQVDALPARQQGEIGVRWSIKDDNLDLSLPGSVQIEYRPVGAANWTPLQVNPAAGQAYWNPMTNNQVEVRVLARDRAGNVGQDKTIVNPRGGGGVQNFGNPIPAAGPDPFKDLERKFVNNKQISLGYDLKDVGPSGVSSVELWYTLYKGRAWTKLSEYPIDLKDPQDANLTKRLTFEVTDEGIYGITLVARSGVGLGDRPPQPGERPQFWIEVDLTKPVVQILDIQVGSGLDKGKLTTHWTARDKNLGTHPIRLSYAVEREGAFTPIADKLANTGKHTWRMPEGLPYQFYVKVEAIDLAGNIGESITLEKVKVDLSLPKAKIIDIIPGGR